MPLVYTENVWTALYAMQTPGRRENGVVVVPSRTIGYSRARMFPGGFDDDTLDPIVGPDAPLYNTRKDWLTGYGLDNNARVGVIGSAFGFLNEYLIDQGITDVWGIEPSPYIWANTDEMRPDVLAQTIQATIGVDSKATIQGLLQAAGYPNPRTFDWIVDEDALSSQLDDAGIAAFLTGCEDLLQGNARSRIIHIVTPLPGRDTQILWKDMATWKAYAPDHTWVDARTGLVV